MFDDINTWLSTASTGAQTTLGWLAVIMLILFALGVIYYVAARALIGVWPALYAPLQGDWVKVTAVTWVVGIAAFGALYAMITAAIGSNGFTGLP